MFDSLSLSFFFLFGFSGGFNGIVVKGKAPPVEERGIHRSRPPVVFAVLGYITTPGFHFPLGGSGRKLIPGPDMAIVGSSWATVRFTLVVARISLTAVT